VQQRPVFGPGALAYPERGLGVAEQRERLKKLGIDPDQLRPDPAQLQHLQLERALQELHRAGLLDDDEFAAKSEQLRSGAGTSAPPSEPS
jgi:SOS response regulatory protein OraA/RecX